MKKSAYIGFVVAFLLSVTIAVAKDTASDKVYENKNIGIQVTFPEDWQLYTSRETAPAPVKSVFPPDKGPDASPLFLGISSNQQASSLLSLEEYNGSISEYFELLYLSRKDTVTASKAVYLEDRGTVHWTYRTKAGQMELTFLETITKSNNVVVRLSLWTITPLFQKYQKPFEQITEGMRFRVNDQERWESRWQDIYSSPAGKNIAYVEVATDTQKASNACEEGERNVIWQVRGPKNTVYLFGSIHLGKPEFYPFDEKIEAAFERSKYLAVELDPTSEEFKKNIAQVASQTGMLENSKTLEDVLSKGVYNKLLQNFDQMGLPFESFKRFKPWLVSATLSTLKLQSMGYIEDYGVERYFLEKAAGAKEVVEMETFSDQMKLFETMNNEEFLAFTMFSLNSMEHQAGKMITAWQCGDLKTLEQIVFEDYDSYLFQADKIYEKIFFDRNRKMAAKIKEYLKADHNYFVVVGAGHYLGDQGIVKLLKKEGYKVTRF